MEVDLGRLRAISQIVPAAGRLCALSGPLRRLGTPRRPPQSTRAAGGLHSTSVVWKQPRVVCNPQLTSLWERPWGGLLGGLRGLEDPPAAPRSPRLPPRLPQGGAGHGSRQKPFMFESATHTLITQTIQEFVALGVVPLRAYFFPTETPLPMTAYECPLVT